MALQFYSKKEKNSLSCLLLSQQRAALWCCEAAALEQGIGPSALAVLLWKNPVLGARRRLERQICAAPVTHTSANGSFMGVMLDWKRVGKKKTKVNGNK